MLEFSKLQLQEVRKEKISTFSQLFQNVVLSIQMKGLLFQRTSSFKDVSFLSHKTRRRVRQTQTQCHIFISLATPVSSSLSKLRLSFSLFFFTTFEFHSVASRVRSFNLELSPNTHADSRMIAFCGW